MGCPAWYSAADDGQEPARLRSVIGLGSTGTDNKAFVSNDRDTPSKTLKWPLSGVEPGVVKFRLGSAA